MAESASPIAIAGAKCLIELLPCALLRQPVRSALYQKCRPLRGPKFNATIAWNSRRQDRQEETMKYLLSSVVAAALLSASAVSAAEVSLVAPGGIRAAIEQMIPAFEKKTGHKVKATFGSGNGTKAQVTKGDAFDVPIVQPPYPEVVASGNVVTSTETPLAHVAVGIAVRTGQPHPKIATADDVKALFLKANAISYPDPKGGAAAGVSMEETLKKLGLADQMRPK